MVCPSVYCATLDTHIAGLHVYTDTIIKMAGRGDNQQLDQLKHLERNQYTR